MLHCSEIKENFMRINFQENGAFLLKGDIASQYLGLTEGGLRDLKKSALGPAYYKKDASLSKSDHIYYAIDHVIDFSLSIENEKNSQKRGETLLYIYLSCNDVMLLDKKSTSRLLGISIAKLDRLTKSNDIIRLDATSPKSPVKYHITSIIDYVLNLEYIYTV